MTHTRQPRVGPICPVCKVPLFMHFVFVHQWSARAAVRSGLSSRPCFEIQVR